MVAGDNFRVSLTGSNIPIGRAAKVNTTEVDFDNDVLEQLQETINLIRNNEAKVILSKNGQRLSDHQVEVGLSVDLRDKLNDVNNDK